MTEPTDRDASVPAKASDVRYQEATFAPSAECRGVLDYAERDERGEPRVVEACAWTWAPLVRVQSGEARKQARYHARYHPGHEVEVVRRTVAVYWVDPPTSNPSVPEPGDVGEVAP